MREWDFAVTDLYKYINMICSVCIVFLLCTCRKKTVFLRDELPYLSSKPKWSPMKFLSIIIFQAPHTISHEALSTLLFLPAKLQMPPQSSQQHGKACHSKMSLSGNNVCISLLFCYYVCVRLQVIVHHWRKLRLDLRAGAETEPVKNSVYCLSVLLCYLDFFFHF